MSKFLHALAALAVVATALADENPPYEGPPIPIISDAKVSATAAVTRIALGIDLEMTWTPIFDTERGSARLPIRICAAPGVQ
ncbi:hypothetical protein C8J57DRAFT_1538081 [Mycena rebaudengoi]|nr:hypothetical protein C8J57DRAFT_1538081 [Mycena rebaudengoi]